MSTYSSTLEANYSKLNERQHNKSTLDREYKLLTANQSVFTTSKNLGRDTLDNSRDQFWKEASIRSEKKPSNKEEPAAPVEGLSVDNNYYKNEIQNLRSSLNQMRDKAVKTKLVTSELRTTNTRQLEGISEAEKDRIKKLQAEREGDVAESLSQREGVGSPLEKNPIGSAGKKKVQMAYEQKEKEVYNRVMGSSSGKKKEDYLNSNWNSKSLNQSGRSYKGEMERSPGDLVQENDDYGEENDFSDSQNQGYFTNKELVRAKYEQYEKDLLRKREKGQSAKKRLEDSGQKEESLVQRSAEKRSEKKEIGERKQSSLYPVQEETETEKFQDRNPDYTQSQSQIRDNNDEFFRASAKRDRKLQEEYDDIVREKSWRNKGLVYRENFEQSGAAYEEMPEHRVEYPTKKLPNNKFLELELEKLKEENQRIKREIKDIQRRNSVEQRHYSAKLTHKDFKNSFSPQNNFSGSQKLTSLRKQRKIEDEEDFAGVQEGEDIKKTIQRARKSVHQKMETSKLERSWKEARNRSTADLGIEDIYAGCKSSRSAKFSAGVPSNHLRESAFLLAKGIPTVYVSNRSINSLTKSFRGGSSRSYRK